MNAIVVGATGATGKDLLKQLLEDRAYKTVIVFVRHDLGIIHPKLTTFVVDFNDIPSWSHLIQGDVLFSLLGTTRAKAGGKEQQWKVDYDYQYEIAKAARKNGVHTMELMSAVGADKNSRFFYSRMKGELEEAIQHLDFPRLIITRPPSLVRRRSDRWMERISVFVLRVINKLGLLRHLAPMKTQNVARVLRRTAKNKNVDSRILEPEEMRIVAL